MRKEGMRGRGWKGRRKGEKSRKEIRERRKLQKEGGREGAKGS